MHNDNLSLDKLIPNGSLAPNIMYYCWNILHCIKCIFYNLSFLLTISESAQSSIVWKYTVVLFVFIALVIRNPCLKLLNLPAVNFLHDCTLVYICEIVPVFPNAVSVHVHEISVWFPVVVNVQETGVVFPMVTSTLQCTTHSCVQQSIHCA